MSVGSDPSGSAWTRPWARLGHRTVGITEHYSKLSIGDVAKVARLVG